MLFVHLKNIIHHSKALLIILVIQIFVLILFKVFSNAYNVSFIIQNKHFNNSIIHNTNHFFSNLLKFHFLYIIVLKAIEHLINNQIQSIYSHFSFS